MQRSITRRASLAFVLIFVLTLTIIAFARGSAVPSTEAAADECQTFQETGKQVCGKFLTYWRTHGGLAQQGFPISDVFDEKNADPPAGDGQVHKVQYFERARFEEHLEAQPPYDVQLGLLGAEQYNAKYGQKVPGSQLLVVNGKRNETKIGTDSPKAGFTFFVVDLTLTNTTGKELSSNPLYFKVKTDKDFSYEFHISSFQLAKALKLTKLAPNESARGELSFEVPTNEVPKTFSFEDFSTKFSVNL